VIHPNSLCLLRCTASADVVTDPKTGFGIGRLAAGGKGRPPERKPDLEGMETPESRVIGPSQARGKTRPVLDSTGTGRCHSLSQLSQHVMAGRAFPARRATVSARARRGRQPRNPRLRLNSLPIMDFARLNGAAPSCPGAVAPGESDLISPFGKGYFHRPASVGPVSHGRRLRCPYAALERPCATRW